MYISPLSLYMYISHIADGVDVQVEDIEGEDGCESRMMFGMHTPTAKKKTLCSSLRGAERSLKTNHARRERHVTCVRTHGCTRTMHARAGRQACVAHAKHMCPPNPRSALFSTIGLFWRHDVTHLSSICICSFRAAAREQNTRQSEQHFGTSKWRGCACMKGRLSNGGNWVSLSGADTLSVKTGAQDGALCSSKTAAAFSRGRFGILGLDESSSARPGEADS